MTFTSLSTYVNQDFYDSRIPCLRIQGIYKIKILQFRDLTVGAIYGGIWKIYTLSRRKKEESEEKNEEKKRPKKENGKFLNVLVESPFWRRGS